MPESVEFINCFHKAVGIGMIVLTPSFLITLSTTCFNRLAFKNGE